MTDSIIPTFNDEEERAFEELRRDADLDVLVERLFPYEYCPYED